MTIIQMCVFYYALIHFAAHITSPCRRQIKYFIKHLQSNYKFVPKRLLRMHNCTHSHTTAAPTYYVNDKCEYVTLGEET